MYPNLNAEMARNDIKQDDLVELLKIAPSTVSDKLNGKTDFKLRECKLIQSKLPNSSLEYLFETKKEIKS